LGIRRKTASWLLSQELNDWVFTTEYLARQNRNQRFESQKLHKDRKVGSTARIASDRRRQRWVQSDGNDQRERQSLARATRRIIYEGRGVAQIIFRRKIARETSGSITKRFINTNEESLFVKIRAEFSSKNSGMGSSKMAGVKG